MVFVARKLKHSCQDTFVIYENETDICLSNLKWTFMVTSLNLKQTLDSYERYYPN